MHEAMERLRFEAFLESLDDSERHSINLVVSEMMESFPESKFFGFMESPQIEAIWQNYESFIQNESAKSRTFAFWSMYLRMTGVH